MQRIPNFPQNVIVGNKMRSLPAASSASLGPEHLWRENLPFKCCECDVLASHSLDYFNQTTSQHSQLLCSISYSLAQGSVCAPYELTFHQ